MGMSLITSLPEDIIIDCVSLVPRRYYPTLSLVSKFFRSLIASPEVYARRALMDRTECFLYVTISLTNNIDGIGNRNNHWYTLRRKPNSTGTGKDYSLVPITSLPHTPTFGSYVAVDSKIIVIGGSLDAKTSSGNNTLLIDCRFHKARQLPNMPREVACSVSGLINERIYVIGGLDFGCPFSPQGVMDLMVFDIKSETWESRMRPDMVVCKCNTDCNIAQTWDNKIYFNNLVYNPNEDRWEKDEILNSKSWYGNGSVMDGVLYYYSPSLGRLFAYDFKEKCWKVVKGVERLMSGHHIWARTVIYDKKGGGAFPC